MLLDSKNREILHSVLNILKDSSEIGSNEENSLLARLEKMTGYKGKDLYAPLRAAVTGKTKGPELVKTLPLIGRERIIKRLKMALELS